MRTFTLALCLLLLTALNGSAQRFHPGDTVPDDYIIKHGADGFFRCMEIPDTIFTLMQGRSYPKNCPVKRSELRYLLCLHCNMKGEKIIGEMVINRSIANEILTVLRKLYDAAYPIEHMRLIDYYNADDETSMRANNTSAFNFRYISHTTTISKHGSGLAIDFNPLYNPYHKTLRNGTTVTEPSTGVPYLNRSKDFPYKIKKGDLLYRLMTQRKFTWGGAWKSMKDYQHFER